MVVYHRAHLKCVYVLLDFDFLAGGASQQQSSDFRFLLELDVEVFDFLAGGFLEVGVLRFGAFHFVTALDLFVGGLE